MSRRSMRSSSGDRPIDKPSPVVDRPRSRGAHLHVGFDRPTEGRDADARQHRRGGRRRSTAICGTRPTTSSSTCCRSRSTTASIRCFSRSRPARASCSSARSRIRRCMLDLMARERVTALPIVPMMAALLLRHDLGAYDLSSLRYITNTGAALPPAHIAALRPATAARPDLLDVRPDRVQAGVVPVARRDRRAARRRSARPMDNVEVYLVDERRQRRSKPASASSSCAART